MDVEFVYVAIGPDVVDVLAAVASPIAIDCGARHGQHGSCKVSEIIVDPVGAGVNVEFVDVAVGANVIDVLTVIGTPVASEGGASGGRDTICEFG